MQAQINELAKQCGVSNLAVEEMANAVAKKLNADFSIDEMLLEVQKHAKKHHDMSLIVLEAHAELESCKIDSQGGVLSLSEKAIQYMDFQGSIFKLLKN